MSVRAGFDQAVCLVIASMAMAVLSRFDTKIFFKIYSFDLEGCVAIFTSLLSCSQISLGRSICMK